MKKIAHGILAEARETRQHYQVTGSDFDRVKANMYSIFECYAHGLISWDQVKTKFQKSIREYVSLYKGTEHLKEEIDFMRQEYKTVLRNYKPALDEYRKVAEQKLTKRLLDRVEFIGESAAQKQSSTYYNNRMLSESDLIDTTRLSWERVMEAYPNLTAKDEERVRMLTIFEGPTLDTTQMITTVMSEGPNDNIGRRERAPNGQWTGSTRGITEPTGDADNYPPVNFNPNAGHMDQPSHPQNRGLARGITEPTGDADNYPPVRMSSPRPKLRPKNFDDIVQRAEINRAVRSAMGEGWEELPPIDRDRYGDREHEGLEGPIMTRSGKVVYYDPKAGMYYDSDTDMYMSYDDFKMLDKKGMHMTGKVDEARSKQLHDIKWPDTDEDGDSEMETHAYNAIRHNFPAYDAYDHVYSMTPHRDWLEANKEELINMFAGYGLPMDWDESVDEASTVNGVNMDGKKRWKQTSMSPEAAAKEYGKDNVRVKKGALRNGDDMVEVFTEGHSPHPKGSAKYKKHMAAMHAGMNEGAEDFVRDMTRVHGWSYAKAEAEARRRFPDEYNDPNENRHVEVRINGKPWKVVAHKNIAFKIKNTLEAKGKQVELYYTDKAVSESVNEGKLVRNMRVQHIHNGNTGTVVKGGDKAGGRVEVEWDSGETTVTSGKYLAPIKHNKSVTEDQDFDRYYDNDQLLQAVTKARLIAKKETGQTSGEEFNEVFGAVLDDMLGSLAPGDWDEVERIMSTTRSVNEVRKDDVEGFDARTIKSLADLKVDYPHAPDTLSAILRALEDVKRASKREDHTHGSDIDKLEKRVDDLEKDHASMQSEATRDEENEFHAKLDKLVHKTFGKRKEEMNEWGGDDQYEAAERIIEIALGIFEEMLDNGEDELRARAEAHDYLKGELGDLGVTHGDIESKQYHGELENEIIEIMNYRDKGMAESESNPYASQDIMSEDPPVGIDFDFDNLPKVDWSKYSKEDIQKFVDNLEALDFEDGFQLDGEYHGMYRQAANWVEKNVLNDLDERKMTKKEKSKEKRLKKKYDDSDMKQSMKDQYGDDWESVYFATIRKRAMEQFDENFAGAFASVAQPMGKMQRRNKVKEDQMMTEAEFDEAAGEKDACYHKVKSRYKVWPSAYASGALVKCRKVGAKNWGKSKK